MPRFSLKRTRPDPIALADRARDARQWPEAARHYRIALVRDPCNPPIWVQYGHALKECGHLEPAEAAYRRALASDPAADTYLQLGHVLKIQGRTDEALASYLSAIVRDQSLQDAARELAGLGWSEAEFDELDAMLRRHARDPAPTTLGELLDLRTAAVSGDNTSAADEMLRRRLADSGLFDPVFYTAQNGDIAVTGMDPLDHYIRYGGREGRDPSAAFDATAYLEIYPAAAVSNSNPLLHYLEIGQKDARSLRAVRPLAPRPAAISWADWQTLAARVKALRSAEPQVDVIIPIYRGIHETANSLYAVVKSQLVNGTAVEVVAIDDCAPEPELTDLLDRLSALGLFSLLRNEENLGFVATVNRGMSLHRDRDVVLLNSDTEVYGNWIDRLRDAVGADPIIGTVTPFSNNATICSYPLFCQDFPSEFELAFEEIDRLAGEINRGRLVDIPTGVGFCLYIRRECLNEVGLFDVGNFGRGYGEENDFCRRIATKGWRNVLAGNVFVRHLGRASFGGSARDREQHALKVMDRLHPSYLKTIDLFCRRDPLMPLRRRLDLARLRRSSGDRAMMMVSHHHGGGTDKHVLELCALLEEVGVASYILQPLRANGNLAEIVHPRIRDIPNIGYIDVKHGLAEAVELLHELGVFHMHVHHLSGYTHESLHFFPALCREAGIGYDFTFHDYVPICPRINMIDASGVFCGRGDLTGCEACIKAAGSPFGDVNVGAWRADYERLLRGARRLFAPDDDVRQRLQQLMPSLHITVRPHPEAVPAIRGRPLQRAEGDPLRVAVIGAIGPHKGSRQLKLCAEDAARRRLPISYVLFGHSDIPELADLPNVEVTGPYRQEELQLLLARRPCHLAFIPSVWPETYSYVLSEALSAGLFPVAFDLGAQARRTRAFGWGLLLPLAIIDRPREVNNALLSCKVPAMPDRTPVAGAQLYADILADYYQLDRGPAASADAPVDTRTLAQESEPNEFYHSTR
jgi:GT2 family glycosyltransferase